MFFRLIHQSCAFGNCICMHVSTCQGGYSGEALFERDISPAWKTWNRVISFPIIAIEAGTPPMPSPQGNEDLGRLRDTSMSFIMPSRPAISWAGWHCRGGGALRFPSSRLLFHLPAHPPSISTCCCLDPDLEKGNETIRKDVNQNGSDFQVVS